MSTKVGSKSKTINPNQARRAWLDTTQWVPIAEFKFEVETKSRAIKMMNDLNKENQLLRHQIECIRIAARDILPKNYGEQINFQSPIK